MKLARLRDASLSESRKASGSAEKKSVLISGIGVAGPTLAYWLSIYGFSSTFVENAPHLRTGGYVIDFWGRGFDVAEKMGIIPALKREGYNVRELRLVGASGRRIGSSMSMSFVRRLTAAT